MTPRDVETLDFLEALAEDPSVSKTLSRQAVILAINTAAENHRGRVSAAWVRPHLPAWVNPSQVGAVISALSKQGLLSRTTEICESGNAASRNSTRIMPVYHRPRHIPTDPTERAALAAELAAQKKTGDPS